MDILLKKRIMRRVYLVWFIRSIYAKLAVLGAILIVASFHIHFANVFLNTISASTNLAQFVNYIVSSFAAAGAVSKIMFAGIIIATIFAGRGVLNTQIKQRVLG